MKLPRQIIFMFLMILAISLPAAAVALTNQLEIDFPEIGGVKPGYSFGLANWVQYIFLFSLAVVGLAVIASFVYAGILWLTAGDNESQVKRALERIKSTVIGLLLLLGSYIILNTINPDLVQLKNNILELNIGSSGGILGENGAACSGNSECQSQKCDPATGVCVSLDIGERCSSSTQCASKSCDYAEQYYRTCQPPAGSKLEVGQRCSNAFQCASGYCGYAKGNQYKTCLASPVAENKPEAQPK